MTWTYEKCYKRFRSNKKQEGYHLKPNILGLIGGVIAFISLVLPWWSMALSASALGMSYSASVSIYPYQATASTMGFSSTVSVNLWYGWAALALIIVGGILGIAGSLLTKGRIVILVGGLLALLSIVIFALGLQSELSQPLASGFPQASLFSSGSYNGLASYVTYLSFGFWIALVSAIIILVASARKTVQVPPSMPIPTSPSPPQPS
jgi:hypothetical protein